MKKATIGIFIIVLILMQTIAVSAISESEARDAWLAAKKNTRDTQEQYNEAKLTYAANNSLENQQAVVDTGKLVLHAALNEAEAWLIWKKLEAENNPEVPGEIKNSIINDVEANLAKIESLRTDVDNVDNQLELGIVFLKMIGKYFELVADVARNSGMLWSYIANTRADKIDEYEGKMRDIAEGMEDNTAILQHLDDAKSELETARRNIDNAENVYEQVRIPGTPVLKFAEGNNYLRAAQANMLAAYSHIEFAYNAMG